MAIISECKYLVPPITGGVVLIFNYGADIIALTLEKIDLNLREIWEGFSVLGLCISQKSTQC